MTNLEELLATIERIGNRLETSIQNEINDYNNLKEIIEKQRKNLELINALHN